MSPAPRNSRSSAGNFEPRTQVRKTPFNAASSRWAISVSCCSGGISSHAYARRLERLLPAQTIHKTQPMPVRAIDDDGYSRVKYPALFFTRWLRGDGRFSLAIHKRQHGAFGAPPPATGHAPQPPGACGNSSRIVAASHDKSSHPAFVHEINLAAALQPHLDRCPNQLLVELRYDRLDRFAVFGRSF